MTKVDEELNKILSDEKGDENSGQPSGAADDSNKDQKQDQGQKNADDEVAQKKAEELANLNKAIIEAQDKLRDLRKAKKAPVEEDEDLPSVRKAIDNGDVNAKAWDKHMDDKMSPVQQEMEKEKDEVRKLALDEFLTTKPSLAKNSDKLKEVMANYNALSKAYGITERNKEVIIVYLRKAYAAVFDDQLMSAAREARVTQAEQDTVLSDIAVSRGATNYRDEKEPLPIKLTRADEAAILQMGYPSVESWMEDYKKYSVPK